MWFPVDWLHTSVCLARALSFAHHPLPQSESLSDPQYKQEYLQIHKFRKSWNNPDMKWTYTLLRDNRWELVGMQLYSEIYEKYTPCMAIGGNVSRGIWKIYTPAWKSGFVWGAHQCDLVGMYPEVFSEYLEFWVRLLSSLSIRQACVAPHSSVSKQRQR